MTTWNDFSTLFISSLLLVNALNLIIVLLEALPMRLRRHIAAIRFKQLNQTSNHWERVLIAVDLMNIYLSTEELVYELEQGGWVLPLPSNYFNLLPNPDQKALGDRVAQALSESCRTKNVLFDYGVPANQLQLYDRLMTILLQANVLTEQHYRQLDSESFRAVLQSNKLVAALAPHPNLIDRPRL